MSRITEAIQPGAGGIKSIKKYLDHHKCQEQEDKR
jgi:hypothetical protein